VNSRLIAIFLLAVALVLSGCPAPYIANKYIASVQGEVGRVRGGRVFIEIDPDIDIEVRGECLPKGGACRIVIFWFYAKSDLVEFSDGAFVARNIQNHNIEYGSTQTGLENLAVRDGGNEQEIGKVEVVHVSLGQSPPEEFEFEMPKLNVNGIEKELPVIHFKHTQGIGLNPLYNY